jgi:hypothetical protein
MFAGRPHLSLVLRLIVTMLVAAHLTCVPVHTLGAYARIHPITTLAGAPAPMSPTAMADCKF